MSRESSILPEDLATQSVRLKEEQLRREEEKVEHLFVLTNHTDTYISLKLREIELRVQREINEKRQELLAKEESLRYASELGVKFDSLLLIVLETWSPVLLRKDPSWICRREAIRWHENEATLSESADTQLLPSSHSPFRIIVSL